ncbi:MULTISPECIES: DEAD/DEAH box helicase [unclassified Flavobacterium]|uniref:DEAD/DEAH box helicase n=1 Tax=unclassified Flavobacterium TaxID=196869 RepID=UPI001F137001|nr:MULTISPECIES: DEAD/DEAH box helicase [unclassified Flavobacterium]UMY65115.1 DEAD/DEAH box helicase [Flavobacterium sp. HJ-32-4]
MIYQELKRWIAQSESWQAFIDYKIANEEQANYTFYNRPQDFYISLLTKLQDILDRFDEEESPDVKRDLISLAKGLEIYSLRGKRENFSGVNYSRNMLYVASLYYLADFPATSVLLLKQFQEEEFQTEIEKFVYYFLSRNYTRKQGLENPYFRYIIEYLRLGNDELINTLRSIFENILSPDNQIESHLFVLTYIAKSILKKFSTNNLWYDLKEYATEVDWKTYVRFNIGKSPQIWSFFPSQQTAIRRGLLTFDRAFSLQTPTSSGKTSIAELVIYNELSRNPESKILYLAPFRALASELKNNLGRNLSTQLGIKVKTIYGGNIVTDSDRLSIEQSNVLISTPEKFMAIELGLSGILDDFRTVICDEGHLIDNTTRGISYELLLSRLKNTEFVERRFVFLSAIIPNIEIINSWLGGSDDDIARSNYRPTEIELAFLNQVSASHFNLEINPNDEFPTKYILNRFLSPQDFSTQNGTYNINSFKSKTVAAALKSLNSGAVAIFSPTKDNKRGVSGLALEVIKQLETSLPKPIAFCDTSEIEKVVEYFKYIFGTEYLLTICAENGFLYHHGDLPQFIRELVETTIRNEKVKFLICTSTLAEGVNLPIKTLIISNARRYVSQQQPNEPLPLRDLKNLIGRAGRAGKETKGTVIVVNPNDQSILSDVIANRNLETVKGFLYYVVQVIERYITRNSTHLSNELLDQLKEADYIDNSIIQLLAEDAPVENLEQEINTLIENTLTYYQSDDALKTRLRELFALRAERVRPIVEGGSLDLIRYTGIPLRSFSRIEGLVDYEQDFLSEIENPLDSRWINFLFDILYEIEDFNNSIPFGISKERFIDALAIWIEGGWYHDVAESLNLTVDETLVFIRFLEYGLQNSAGSIVKYIDYKRTENEEETSDIILNWSNYVIYGVDHRLKLDLMEINIPDRIMVQQIANWFIENEMEYNDQDNLRNLISIHQLDISKFIENKAPNISVDLFERYIKQ